MKTQKWFALILSLGLAGTIAHAQFIKAVGLKAGVAISNIRLTDVTPINISGHLYYPAYDTGNVVSPSITLFAKFLDSEHLGLQADLTYLRKGAGQTTEMHETTINDPVGGGTVHEYTWEENFQYLELAVALQPRLPLGDLALYAHLGPTASYLLSVNNFVSIDRMDRFEIGYTLGLGAELGHLLDSHLFVEARYAGDFSSFFEGDNAKLWNRSWIFVIGTTL